MKKLRILIVIFFVAVTAVFAFSLIRERMTSDYKAPVITAATDNLQISVSATEADLLAGMSATDNLDGDVTNTLVVVSKTKFYAKGARRVNYAAFDGNNNVGTYERNVLYTDYHSPRFVLTQPLRFVSGNSSYDYLANVSAYDCLDGNITQQIKIMTGETEAVSDTVSHEKINLQVTNSGGDTSTLELTASFEDHESYSLQSPALTDYVAYVKQGEKPDYRALLYGVWSSGMARKFADTSYDAASDVSVSDSAVDYNTPGTYVATYQLSRATGENGRAKLGTTNLIVVVEG